MRHNKKRVQLSRSLSITMTTCALISLFIVDNIMNKNEFLSKFVSLSFYIETITFFFPQISAKQRAES